MTNTDDASTTRETPDGADLGLIEIARRCETHGLEYEWLPRPNDLIFLRISLPDGRQNRRVVIVPSEAEAVLASNFESISFLSDYDAFCDRKVGTIEALFSSDPREFLSSFPGAVEVDPETLKHRDRYVASRRMFSFVTEHNGIEIEISPTSEFFSVAGGFNAYSLKIRGAQVGSQEREIEQLERYALNLFLSIEVNLDVACRLDQITRPRPRRGPTRDPALIAFPRTEYEREPLSLFLYGRSVPNLPLLEYLSYYQVLEYFFPLYSKREAISRMRNELLSPSFSAASDASVARLISASSPSVQTMAGEREQLKLTIRGVVADADIRDHLTTDGAAEYFKKGAQILKECPSIVADVARGSLADQVAERIYDIRCRIVHTKIDGGDGRGLLVATSPEVRMLHRDVELLRLIARKAVIASGSFN